MNRIKQLREEQGLTMKEASKRLDLPYTTYVNYEKGLREPNSEMLIKISTFFNCSIDYLLCKSNDRIDDATLDSAIEADQFLLQLTGNLYAANQISKLIESGDLAQAQAVLSRYVDSDVADLIANLHLEVSDVDTHLQQLMHYFQQLNAQGQERLCRYAEDLTGNPSYKKEKPSEEG